MNGRLKLFLISGLLLLSSALFARQKEAKDSLIRLVEASSAQLQEVSGVSYRKIIGPAARFFHNNTYLVCDTALWNVNTNVIKALGNVQILQENTFLKSDKIDYIIDKDLAQFRGSLVELFDKEGNVLRTNYLDYNTKDSVATFYSGGAMRNADGNLIESRNGEYRAADKIFSFKDNVQMFTDSVFIKSNKVDYNTVENKAYFGTATTAWQDDNMLFANRGSFDREAEVFNFSRDSYIFTKDQELWADTLTYFKATGVATLTDNIQILDTVQKSFCFADRAEYNPDPMKIRLTRNPSVAMYTVENGVRDTIFLAADTIDYYTINYCDVDKNQISRAEERKRLSDIDPLLKIETEGAARRKENEDKANSQFINGPIKGKGEKKEDEIQAGKEAAVETTVEAAVEAGVEAAVEADGVETAGLGAVKDSLAANSGQVVEAPDSTSVVFIDAWNKVKVFKNDIQALCDSLVYTGLDSMARMYINPVMWNDVKHQFTADSIQIVMKDNVVSKANLISEAFIASQEDTVHFNQIKGAEMVAYFSNNDLVRYDALGGASMIFYVEEDSLITMMNQKEGKIISARLQDRKIQRIKYFENLKNNLLPTFALPVEEQRLRGFSWRGDERPLDRFVVSDRKIRESQREEIASSTFPDYPYAGVYFSDTRDSIMMYKAHVDSLRLAAQIADAPSDVAAPADTLQPFTQEYTELDGDDEPEEIIIEPQQDDAGSVGAIKEMIGRLEADILSKEEIKALPKEQRRAVRKEQRALRKKLRNLKKELEAHKK